jgi:hypothetical protein
MQSHENDPSALMFSCEECGHWPMALQAEDPMRYEARFACPQCRAHAQFSTRRVVSPLRDRAATGIRTG